MSQRATLKASEEGKNLIKQARIKKGWVVNDPRWLQEASKILEPNRSWDNEPYAVTSASWKRFREASQPIEAGTFKAFCAVLGLDWEEVVGDRTLDLSLAPALSDFYGRSEELSELQHWFLQDRCRLIVVHGMGGIGKSALARQVVENISHKCDRLLWRSLDSTPPFQTFLADLVQFLSQGQERPDISVLMHYLHQYRCLLVLDAWEAITDNDSEDYASYTELVRRIAKEAHKSCLLLLSREKPPYIELLEGELVRFQKLKFLSGSDAKEILKAEGLSGTEDELDILSARYNNPWVIKRVARLLTSIFGGDLSDFAEASVIVDDVITNFLDDQFNKLSPSEKNIIYWIAIRRNSATWRQLQIDTKESFSLNEILQILRNLIEKLALVDRIRSEDDSFIYILDPVTLKYITNLFVQDNYQDIIQVIKSKDIKGDELFITHCFIAENPEDDELKQEQIKRIVKPIQKKLLNKLVSKERVELELKMILSRLEELGLNQGYARQNILDLQIWV